LSVDQLTVVLKYHVLPARVDAAAATTVAMATPPANRATALGGAIELTLQGSTIRLDGTASVVTPNVMASNGVIHGINAVLLPSIFDVASTDPRFSSLAAAVTASNQPALVSGTLDNNAITPKLTVFAPTNAGFDALVGALRGTDDGGTTGITGLGSFTPAQLRPVLAYHVVTSGAVSAAMVQTGPITTAGGTIAATRSGSTVTVDGVQVAIADIRTANGIIHAIPQVLLPSIADIASSADSTPTFSSLTAALALADSLPDGGTSSTGLIAALDTTRADGGGYTVFAPTNAAFTGLVTALRGTNDGGTTGITALTSFSIPQVTPVLRYHVVPAPIFASQVPTTATQVDTLGGKVSALRTGTNVTVDGKSVAVANIFAKNGVIHVIGDVLLPSIADVVTTEPSLSGLASLVVASPSSAGVAAALDGTTNFTLFAPSNMAVAGIPAPAPSGQTLANILLFHAGTSVGTGPTAVNSPIYASTVLGLTGPVDLSTGFMTRTLRVGPVTGTVRVAPNPATGPSATLSGSSIQVIQPNLFTSNGVIHVINGVLLP
jgi:uncharacterized surface protein with fasciclin (FAS1) repeats